VRPEEPDDKLAGIVPPHDLDAEAAVLSACMLRGDGAAVDEVSPLVAAEDFYSEAHRRIFEAIVDLAARGQPVDVVQVGSWLKERQRLAQVGGAGYLTEILDAAPVVWEAHLRAYAKRVRARARMRDLALVLQRARVQIYMGVPDEETDDFYARLEDDIGKITTSTQVGELKAIGPIAKAVVRKLHEHKAKGGGILGISTGFRRLDRLTGGLHDGDLTIVAARPGLGKTSFIMNICDDVTLRDYAAAFFSLEMPEDQLATRLLCSRTRVNLAKTRTGGLTDAELTRLNLEAHEMLPRWIHIDDTPGQTWPMIKSKLRRFVAHCTRHGKKVGACVVDFLQLMKTASRKGANRAELIGEIAREAKATAKELGIPIVLLAQLNRDVEKRGDKGSKNSKGSKRPVMSDVRDSGEIEEAADNVILLYRDDYYDPDSDERNLAEVIVGKQRNGPTGVIKLGFDREWTRFYNLTDGDDEAPPEDDGQRYEITQPERDAPMSVAPPPPLPNVDDGGDEYNAFTDGL